MGKMRQSVLFFCVKLGNLTGAGGGLGIADLRTLLKPKMFHMFSIALQTTAWVQKKMPHFVLVLYVLGNI